MPITSGHAEWLDIQEKDTRMHVTGKDFVAQDMRSHSGSLGYLAALLLSHCLSPLLSVTCILSAILVMGTADGVRLPEDNQFRHTQALPASADKGPQEGLRTLRNNVVDD